ncbi:hypothetical protein D8B26_001727 [Coccidioides posadasii str. Silveira]|uniref:Uncharacterized protein n=3 Tax=Coccidioides posadasii TaxID=199306 RepID=E9CW75_COCPS|nr:hypothetical protein CPC735_049690 [Coccidioides posadasii C735 delta SOWgp]EER23599.1 hypothetical protein CPC735_049690 [Coccidioides posadasii C735 delta SOWgp]EFW21551.1 conserved hypothetical protein [Coccidioides posadasii str. Silveira]KMM65025.1 hypothetical protein CPAG_01377 [Coccidioides posadasii RMSCC 3488]QVM07024.1 hypothetical protein D8B26_001727 [Coccidioides posadasii str. Silveira]|eukprot:XP_003065744.1 hypothetical protein CPC735_049690 [Coccidioides posadasii C735 delta SOWgp]
MEDTNSFQTFAAQKDLLVTIRFSASIPDLRLEVPDPSSTTTAGLKQLIRKKLPGDLAKRRLRLIHAGKALEDGVGLGVSLKFELEPGDVKGKRPIRGAHDTQRLDIPSHATKRILYIHCSIGDIVLSDEELVKEARQSHVLSTIPGEPDLPGSHLSGAPAFPQDHIHDPSHATGASTTTPAPRGFDRLLSAGFTVAEVSALRSQFLALQSLSHTPDTMPVGEELRRLEDRWMDEGSNDALPGGGAGGDLTGGDAFGNVSSDVSGVLDDMLWGSVMGFFWPIGCGIWLLREEGVWSWRKGLAVFVGLLVNFGFGAVRWMN